MKILYTASTARHIRDFHLPVLERLAGDGHAVTVACRDAASLAGPFETLELPYAKGFFSPANLSVWGRLLSRFRRERYGLVLTHTALAGFLTRAALGAAGKRDTVCVHTAHGYLFGKNAPLTGRLTYGFERLCAPVTDAVITMNAEDFGYAGRLTRKGGRVAALAGMGIDTERFRPAGPEEKASLRRTLNLPDGILILYAAEFSGRKNHKPLLKAMRQMAARRPEVTLLLAGDGKRLEASRRLAHRLGVAGRVRFLGYVPDTAPLLRACDGALSVSLSEGMPAGVMEAMACGLPLAASRIKGHTDLLSGRPAFLFDPRKPAGIADGIAALAGEARTPRRGQSGVRLPDKEEAAELFLRRLRETVPSGL